MCVSFLGCFTASEQLYDNLACLRPARAVTESTPPFGLALASAQAAL